MDNNPIIDLDDFTLFDLSILYCFQNGEELSFNEVKYRHQFLHSYAVVETLIRTTGINFQVFSSGFNSLTERGLIKIVLSDNLVRYQVSIFFEQRTLHCEDL